MSFLEYVEACEASWHDHRRYMISLPRSGQLYLTRNVSPGQVLQFVTDDTAEGRRSRTWRSIKDSAVKVAALQLEDLKRRIAVRVKPPARLRTIDDLRIRQTTSSIVE